MRDKIFRTLAALLVVLFLWSLWYSATHHLTSGGVPWWHNKYLLESLFIGVPVFSVFTIAGSRKGHAVLAWFLKLVNLPATLANKAFGRVVEPPELSARGERSDADAPEKDA